MYFWIRFVRLKNVIHNVESLKNYRKKNKIKMKKLKNYLLSKIKK